MSIFWAHDFNAVPLKVNFVSLFVSILVSLLLMASVSQLCWLCPSLWACVPLLALLAVSAKKYVFRLSQFIWLWWWSGFLGIFVLLFGFPFLIFPSRFGWIFHFDSASFACVRLVVIFVSHFRSAFFYQF